MVTTPLITLHRYYIWTNKMRTDFDSHLENENRIPRAQFEIEAFMYMSLWYALLYVVIEGWQELKLKDDKIDSLLKSDNVGLLKSYRHGIFHFQKKYKSSKLEKLDKKREAAKWMRDLNKEFGRFFLEKLNQK